MTDLEKYKNVFSETNITYTCEEYASVIEISINQECLNKETYGAGLDLFFSKETGKLIKISPWGE